MAATFAGVDPNTLAAHPSNVRTDLGDIAGLTASIREGGIKVALTVVATDDGHRIIDGHRRCQASIEASLTLVPCWIRDDLDDANERLTNIVANLHRADLRPTDIAKGYAQLAADFGMSATKIAKATGTKATAVKTALRAAGSGLALAAADRYDLTLDQAAVLAEFDDDPETIKVLVAGAHTGRWDHTLSAVRETVADAKALTEARTALAATGVTVIDESPAWGYEAGRPCDLTQLTTDDGSDIDPDDHASCPGPAAYLDDPDEDPIWVCTDAAANGHRPAWGPGSVRHDRTGQADTNGRPPVDEEAARAAKTDERRKVIAGNKAWKAATTVRLDYIRNLLARRTAPKPTLRFVTEWIMTQPHFLGDGTDRVLAELLGRDTDTASTWRRTLGPELARDATDARLPLVLLTQVAAAIERGMGEGWRHPSPEKASWLTFLAGCGYGLAEIEQTLIDEAPDPQAD